MSTSFRILITGGAGCLGSNLFEHWLARGHAVALIDNFVTSDPAVVPKSVPGLSLMTGTIADRPLVDEAFRRFEPTHVVHSAAAYKDPAAWNEDVATNISGTINVVDAAKRHGVRRFINFQTALCYGAPSQLPIPETHPCRPVSSYAISKLAGEQYVALSGLGYVSIRLASVIAPRLTIGAIPTFYSRLKAGKAVFCTTAIRDYLDIEDFLDILEKVLESDRSGIFNVGPGIGHSISDVLRAVAKGMGVAVPEPLDVRPTAADDVEAVVLDPGEAQRAFAWTPRVSLQDSIARMVRWYDAHGVSAIYSHLHQEPQDRAGAR